MAAKPLPVASPQTIHKVKGAKAVGVREELKEIGQVGAFAVWLRGALRETPSWLVSMLFHMVVLLVLALLTLPPGMLDDAVALLTKPPGPEEPLEPLDPFDPPPLPPITFGNPDVLTSAPLPAKEEQVAAIDPADIPTKYEVKLGDDFISAGLTFGDPLAPVGPPGGKHPDRKECYDDVRHKPEGKAVAAALKWLAEHQLPDGGWSFDHTRCPACRGQCRHAGNLAESRLGATGLALLPFLGAGQTHKEGTYKLTVRRGLYFLISRMKPDGSLYEPGGRMYAHGIAAIALCEAYALTHDRWLYPPAQMAVNFICHAQDPVGGGWRYEPKQPGDTSVVGWQIMALKSGHMAYLQVPPAITRKAYAYLDGVQSESGAQYGYTDPGRGSSATTAIGLLCRMYLGWKKDNPALERGVQWIDQRGPAPTDMYYNYYATQVMRHWDGPMWKQWDDRMKPQLIGSQATAGHEQGSWHFKHGHADRGGRLYCTAMAAMVLEVYYRHLPIYGRQCVESDFPI